MDKKSYDFSGWATRNDIRCSDGRTIRKDAFKHNHGETVPLVWNHNHQDADNVLGHALLENREQGVYAYCSFNNTVQGNNAKELVKHGDICALSIYANQLKQQGGDVIHGAIKEVSLVLAGANPGAFIDNIIAHGEDESEEAYIYNNTKNDFAFPDTTDEDNTVEHSDEKVEHSNEEVVKHSDETKENDKKEVTEKMEGNKEMTVQEVFDTLTEEQKTVVYALIGQAIEDAKNEKGDADVKHNIFESDAVNANEVLTHSEFIEIAQDAKRMGSMKDAFLQHGITNIDYLYPDFKNVTNKPEFINTNPLGWVTKVMNGVHHTPFSRIKMVFADITADEARAKGYVKGNKKTDEVFSLLKRTVDPTTVYKKQSFDRDDIIDITDFDIIPWVKGEMRMKLDEELARAFIFGDGRSTSSQDKINEGKIIPVVKDTNQNLYAMEYEVTVPSGEKLGSVIIDKMVICMNDYEGSGNVTYFTSPSAVSEMLLLKDLNGRRIYKDVNELAVAMNVKEIVTVPAAIIPEGVYGVALDLNDYNVGADKGGAVNMFDDFDIDYNKEKYLIETRCSGALTKPHSAIVLKKATEASE